MQIVIVRHGKPEVPFFGALKANELRRYLKAYDSAVLASESGPPARTVAAAGECKVVISSDLSRSIQSATALRINQLHLSDPIFREAGLPYLDWDSPKLSPQIWTALFRSLWFLGWSPNAESLRLAKLRAKAGAEKLAAYAREYGTALFVGHGFINYFIARELRAAGWQGPAKPGREHWEFGIYTHNDENSKITR